jgi:hypothetical protein
MTFLIIPLALTGAAAPFQGRGLDAVAVVVLSF